MKKLRKNPVKGNIVKARLIKDIKSAVDELKLVWEGKRKARSAEDFLNEF